MHNVAICLLTCELDHLEEWYFHHKSYGFENYLIYVDSKVARSVSEINPNLKSLIKNIKVVPTEHNNIPLQRHIYTLVCKEYNEFDYILFIDSDEYYESKTKNIQEDISILKSKYGNFDGFGLCWRSYGAKPAFENRVPIDKYKQWCPSVYIKSLVNPKSVEYFYSAHGAVFKTGVGNYTSENGEIFSYCKIQSHSSENVWIKHLRMRSKSEWRVKFNRTGWYRNNVPVWYYDQNLNSDDIFDLFNLKCKQPGTDKLFSFKIDE